MTTPRAVYAGPPSRDPWRIPWPVGVFFALATLFMLWQVLRAWA